MKKFLFIMLLAALTACNSSSLVNTPTLTPTLTPIPTPTEVPEMTRPFGDDGLIGQGKIGPWVEASKVEPNQDLLDSVKALDANGEVIVLEVKDAEGKTGQMVFVLERDANGQVTRRFVAWNKDNLGIKRLPENGIVNDLDELVALPGGQGFGVMGLDGILEPIILIDPATGEMSLVDNFIQIMLQPGQPADKSTNARINGGKEVGDAFAAPEQISNEVRDSAVALFEQIGIDPSTYELKMDGEVVVGIDKITGEEVFRDGKFDLRYAVEAAVASGELMPTKYKPKSESYIGVPNRPPDNMTIDYFVPLFKRAREEFKKSAGFDPYISGKTVATYFMLDPDQLAYGMVLTVNKDDPSIPQYLIYETSYGGITFVPVKPVSARDVADFWKNK